MKKRYHEYIFRVTKTNQNGTETTMKKSVFINPWKVIDFVTFHRTENECIALGTQILKEDHYYNIEFIAAKNKELYIFD